MCICICVYMYTYGAMMCCIGFTPTIRKCGLMSIQRYEYVPVVGVSNNPYPKKEILPCKAAMGRAHIYPSCS